MIKKFVVQDSSGKELGEIIYSKGKFELNIALEKEKKELRELLNSYLEKGISDLGEVILKEPIKFNDPLFLNEVQNQLARKRYVVFAKNKWKKEPRLIGD